MEGMINNKILELGILPREILIANGLRQHSSGNFCHSDKNKGTDSSIIDTEYPEFLKGTPGFGISIPIPNPKIKWNK